jgi:hypothetical protein
LDRLRNKPEIVFETGTCCLICGKKRIEDFLLSDSKTLAHIQIQHRQMPWVFFQTLENRDPEMSAYFTAFPCSETRLKEFELINIRA